MKTARTNNIKAIKEEIKEHLAANNIDEAVKRLLDFYRDFYPDKDIEAINISRRWSSLKQKNRTSTLPNNEIELGTNNIVDSIIEGLNSISEEEIKVNKSIIGDQEHLTALLAEQVQQKAVPKDLLVRLYDLHKVYDSTAFHLEVKKLEIRLGEITGLVGENATGKTSLLRIIAGDLTHDKGQLEYPQWQIGKDYNWSSLKEKISYVPQEVPKWEGSLLNNLKYQAVLHGFQGPDNAKEVEYIIRRLGLESQLYKTWRQLSGGYKLRFALAKALIKKPQLLVLDEPLAHLDIKTQVMVLKDLQHLCKSTRYPLAVIISSQHLEEVEAIADYMLYMHEGQLEDMGPTVDYGKDRFHNVFQLACRSATYSQLKQVLDAFPCKKLWYNGQHFFIVTDVNTTAFQVLDYLKKEKLEVLYFADISRSVKTRFYENYL